jgi:hypothetical protein
MHASPVLLHIIETQQSMIRSMQRDARITEDAAVALRMRIDIITRDAQYYEEQYNLYQLFLVPFFEGRGYVTV